MSETSAIKRLATSAAITGGSVLGVGAGLYGVLVAEAKLARKVIGEVDGDPPPDSTGWYGRRRPGPALKIALLGDSSAAGYGVHTVQETPGAGLASGIAEAADRRVYLREFTVVGAKSSDLKPQVDDAIPVEPDLAVIVIGGNDVTNTVLPSASVHHLSMAVTRLRTAGVQVLVATCPDLGTIQPLAPPLRQLARLWSRKLAAAQTIATLEAGGRTVSVGSILGPEFEAAPAVLFGPDQFHPSAEGYTELVRLLIPSSLACLGLIPDHEVELETLRGEKVLDISEAAIQAVKTPGVELDGTEGDGQPVGIRDRVVELRRRRRRPQHEVESPGESEQAD